MLLQVPRKLTPAARRLLIDPVPLEATGDALTAQSSSGSGSRGDVTSGSATNSSGSGAGVTLNGSGTSGFTSVSGSTNDSSTANGTTDATSSSSSSSSSGSSSSTSSNSLFDSSVLALSGHNTPLVYTSSIAAAAANSTRDSLPFDIVSVGLQDPPPYVYPPLGSYPTVYFTAQLLKPTAPLDFTDSIGEAYTQAVMQFLSPPDVQGQGPGPAARVGVLAVQQAAAGVWVPTQVEVLQDEDESLRGLLVATLRVSLGPGFWACFNRGVTML